MSQALDILHRVRVVDEPTAIKTVGVCPNTWEKLKRLGEGPPVTRLSERRLGYRIIDLEKWLDGRREQMTA
jgi:hypothetical protein